MSICLAVQQLFSCCCSRCTSRGSGCRHEGAGRYTIDVALPTFFVDGAGRSSYELQRPHCCHIRSRFGPTQRRLAAAARHWRRRSSRRACLAAPCGLADTTRIRILVRHISIHISPLPDSRASHHADRRKDSPVPPLTCSGARNPPLRGIPGGAWTLGTACARRARDDIDHHQRCTWAARHGTPLLSTSLGARKSPLRGMAEGDGSDSTVGAQGTHYADNGLSLRHSSSGQFNEEPNFLLLTCERHHTFIYFGDNMSEGRELCSTVGTQGARANWISDLTVGWRSCDQLVRWGGGAVCVLEGAFVRRARRERRARQAAAARGVADVEVGRMQWAWRTCAGNGA